MTTCLLRQTSLLKANRPNLSIFRHGMLGEGVFTDELRNNHND